MVIYEALMADDYIKQQASGRIKFYLYPESASMTQPHIVIDSLSPPSDGDYADNEPLTEEYLYQIDVWTKNRLVTKELAKRVKKALRQAGITYIPGGVDEYDKDTGIYRDARRYKAKTYTEEVEALM